MKVEDYNKNNTYSLTETLELLPKLSTSKFTGSADLEVLVKKSKKKNQETIRGSVVLPHSFGEEKKIIVFGDEQASKDAKAAGAVDAGLDDLVEKVEKGSVDYDVVLATPESMSKIAKLGRILGPVGLMPNPGNGTITTDVEKTISDYKKGKVDFKLSEQNTVKVRFGKLDMKIEELSENLVVLLKDIFAETRKIDQQPFARILIKPTMGKAVKVDIESTLDKIKN